MGRPIKDGVDYFSLDCHMSDSVKLIEAEFGLKGFAIIIKLWQKIYSEKGYYTKWSRPVALMFAQLLNVSVNVVDEVVNASIREGIFDQKLYNQYGILTSERIQTTYAAATRKREFVKFEKGYLLIVAPKNWVSSAENLINSADNEVMGAKSKVEKSKVNNITTVTARAREVGEYRQANNLVSVSHEPPARESVIDYFKKLGVSEPEGEADAFIKYNDGLGWVCLPVWVTAADSWAEKIRSRRKKKNTELEKSFDTGEFFDTSINKTYKSKVGKT